jgi:hypothetical protein
MLCSRHFVYLLFVVQLVLDHGIIVRKLQLRYVWKVLDFRCRSARCLLVAALSPCLTTLHQREVWIKFAR